MLNRSPNDLSRADIVGSDPRIEKFFYNSWFNNKADYRVYIAGKCLNLNEVCYTNYKQAHPERADELVSVRKKSFLTQSGLQAKADELAKYYAEHKCFPKICIYDELCVTGHDFCELLYSLLIMIEKFLDGKYELDMRHGFAYARMRASLLNAIEMHVLRMDKEQNMMCSDFRERLFPEEKVYVGKWLPFIKGVNNTIERSPEVENTSYTPTFIIDHGAYNKLTDNCMNNGWSKSKWDVYGNGTIGAVDDATKHYVILQKSHLKGSAQYVLKCRSQNRENGEEYYSVTPYVFWNRAEEGAVEKTLRDLSNCIREDATELSRLLYLESKQLWPCKMHLFSIFASMDLFFQCLQSNDLKREWIKPEYSDLEKIAQNYGFIEDIAPELGRICIKLQEKNNDIHEFVVGLLDSAELIDGLSGGSSGDNQHALYMEYAARYFLKREAEQKKSTILKLEQRVSHTQWTEYNNDEGNGLADYLKSKLFPPECSSMENKIGALTVLLSEGCIGQWGCGRRRLFLRAGEYSQLMAINVIGDYLPALAELERFCHSRCLNVRGVLERFGRFVEKKRNENEVSAKFKEFYDIVYGLDLCFCSYICKADIEEIMEKKDNSDKVNFINDFRQFAKSKYY